MDQTLVDRAEKDTAFSYLRRMHESIPPSMDFCPALGSPQKRCTAPCLGEQQPSRWALHKY